MAVFFIFKKTLGLYFVKTVKCYEKFLIVFYDSISARFVFCDPRK